MFFTAKNFKILFLSLLLVFPLSCSKHEDIDECLKTKWTQSKTYEIKLAVKVSNSNPVLPGGTPGSLNPKDFVSMIIGGNIEMLYCDGTSLGAINLGNSYIVKATDEPADIYASDAWWIGHVVYVYEFGNDKDHLDINLNVKITMADGQTFACTVFKQVYSQQIEQMAGDLFYFILLDIHSTNWIKV